MFLLVIGIIAVIVGLIRGGSLKNLFKGEIKAWYLFLLAILIFLGMQVLGIIGQMHLIASFAFWIQFAAYLILFIAVFLNLDKIWMYILLGGSLLNFVVIFLNQGKMPVYETTVNIGALGGATGSYLTNFAATKVLAGSNTTLWFLGEVIPIPLPVVGEMLSLGTVVVAVAMFMIIQSAMVYTYVDEDEYNKLDELDTATEDDGEETIIEEVETMVLEETDEDGTTVSMEETIVLSDLGDLPDEVFDEPMADLSDNEMPSLETEGDALDELAADPFDFTDSSGEFEFDGNDIFADIQDDGTFDELSDDSYKGTSDDLGEEFFTGLGDEEIGADTFDFTAPDEAPAQPEIETPETENIQMDDTASLDDTLTGGFDILGTNEPESAVEMTTPAQQEEFSFDEPEQDIMPDGLGDLEDFTMPDDLNASEASILDDTVAASDFVEQSQPSVPETEMSTFGDTSGEYNFGEDVNSPQPEMKTMNAAAEPMSANAEPMSVNTPGTADNFAQAGSTANAPHSYGIGEAPSAGLNAGGAAVNTAGNIAGATASTAGNVAGTTANAATGALGAAATTAGTTAAGAATQTNAGSDALKAGAAFAAGTVAGVAASSFAPKNNTAHAANTGVQSDGMITDQTAAYTPYEEPAAYEPEPTIEDLVQDDSTLKTGFDDTITQPEEYDFLSEFEDDEKPYSAIKLEDYEDPEDSGFVEYKEEPLLDDAEKDLDELELEDLVPTDDKIKDAKNILEEAEIKREQVKEQQVKVVERTSTAQTIDVDNPFVIVGGRIVENPYYKFKKEEVVPNQPMKTDLPDFDDSGSSPSLDSGVYVMDGGNLSRAGGSGKSSSQDFVPRRNSSDIDKIRLEEEELSLKLKEERLRRLEDERRTLEEQPTRYTRRRAYDEPVYSEPVYKEQPVYTEEPSYTPPRQTKPQAPVNEIIPESEIIPARAGEVSPLEDGEENPYEKVEMKIGDVEIKFWKKDNEEE